MPFVSSEDPGTQAPGDDYPAVARGDDDRAVDLGDDFVVLPEQTADDTDRGWGEHGGGSDEWLLAERPPHWG
ncbi:hypothetical protein AB0H57_16375 [Micromonospora sp. NPDC050686]|uniref:hypothetical protein n=1 Tax=Micromonospora sp. NPDC050686 TaxID=3154631 RepID=UPI00340383F5